MARADRHPANVDGDFYVDTRCINCDASRQRAPALFGEQDGQSVVVRQPQTDDELEQMWLAALICPTNSIKADPPRKRPSGLYPLHLEGPVHLMGFNSPDSFGANSFLVERPDGNLLVDAPRWTRQLLEPVEALGGIAHVLLTHRDDVADADRYAEHFGAEVWIHELDREAAPYATRIMAGTDPIEICPGVRAVPVPGHTRGSVAFVVDDEYLFTGDSLFWSRRRQDLGVFVRQAWFSLEEQGRSLRRLGREHTFRWIFAGHGERTPAAFEDLPERIERLCDWIEARV